VARLERPDVAGWLIKSTRAPATIEPGWAPGEERELTRCVQRSYRLELVSRGQPVVLWVSGRVRPGVHAVGTVSGPVRADDGDRDGPVLPVRLTPLPDPVDRAELLADPEFRSAEVLRMPAGSNPSWLSAAQLGAVLARTGQQRLGRWDP
jgi:hypothetical protein